MGPFEDYREYKQFDEAFWTEDDALMTDVDPDYVKEKWDAAEDYEWD